MQITESACLDLESKRERRRNICDYAKQAGLHANSAPPGRTESEPPQRASANTDERPVLSLRYRRTQGSRLGRARPVNARVDSVQLTDTRNAGPRVSSPLTLSQNHNRMQKKPRGTRALYVHPCCFLVVSFF